MLARDWALAAGLFCGAALVPQAAVAQEHWFLMSRHGECAKVGTLKRKVPDMGEINDPDSFAGLMRKKGYEVTSARVPVPKDKAQEVKVPKAELFLLFVTPEMCDGFEKR